MQVSYVQYSCKTALIQSEHNPHHRCHPEFQGQSDASSGKSLWAPSSSLAWVKVLQY